MIRRVEFNAAGIGSTNFSSTSISFDSTVTTFDDAAGSPNGTGIFERSRIYGEYTWGKVSFVGRSPITAKQFIAQSYSNLDKSPLMTRSRILRFNNYTP